MENKLEIPKVTPNTNFIKQIEMAKNKRDRRKANKGIQVLALKTLRENDTLRNINNNLEKKIKVFKYSTFLLSLLVLMIFQMSIAAILVR